nr:MAG TPA: hypothetical protein [Caudoviricetes sp.]
MGKEGDKCKRPISRWKRPPASRESDTTPSFRG